MALAPSQAEAKVDFAAEAACSSDVPTSQGGPAPRNRDLLVIRWLGSSSQEFAFRDQVILINAFYSATAAKQARPLGFGPDAVTKATVMLVDHGHSDHSQDVPAIVNRLGIKAVGAPVTGEILRKIGINPGLFQTVTGKGGELLTYGPITIEPILATHTDPATPVFDRTQAIGRTAYADTQAALGLQRTPEQIAAAQAFPNDPRIITEGTISFLFKIGDDYKLVFHGGIGAPTQYEKAAAARTGKVDLLIKTYTFPVPNMAIAQSMPQVELWRPALLIPTHHDDVGGGRFEMPVEPFFEAVRERLPDTRGISPLRKAPVCIDIKTKAYQTGW